MGEKITCDIIRDLMILCEEELCSEDSKRLVLNHVAGCEECKKIYEMIKAPMPETKLADEKDTDRFEENAIKSFKRFKKKLTIETMMLIFAVILTLLFGNYIWREYVKEWVRAVPASQINVTELYQLKNGDIYCTLECDGYFSWKNQEEMKVPDDMRREDCNQAWYEVHFQTRLWGEKETEMLRDSITVIFPKEATPYDDEIDRECASIKYIGTNKNDVLMIWEDNQKLEKVSPEMEEIAKQCISESFGYNYGFPVIVEE